MKRINILIVSTLTFFLISYPLIAVAQDDAQLQSIQRQGAFIKILESYILPNEDRPSMGHQDNVIQQIINVAHLVARRQGLTFDGHMSQEGKIVVGKKGKDGPILVGVEVLHLPKGYVTEHVYNSKGTDAKECIKITKNFMRELFSSSRKKNI